MASSSERRRKRRLLLRSDLWPLQPNTIKQQPATPKKIWWHRTWGWMVTGVGLVAAIVSLLVLYPWLSIDDDFSYEKANPFATSFYVVNEGFLPAQDLSARCVATFNFGTNIVKDGGASFSHFASRLAYKRRQSLPCNSTMSIHGGSISEGSTFIVIIFYRIAFLRIPRSQEFRFKLAKSEDGQYHWLYGE